MSSDMDDQNSAEQDLPRKPQTLEAALEAAPRIEKASLRRFVDANKELLRRYRDKGVSWDNITAIVAQSLNTPINKISLETYLARALPAKKAREIERAESLLGERSGEGRFSRSEGSETQRLGTSQNSTDVGSTAGASPAAIWQARQPNVTGVNRFMPKRPPPKEGG